MSTPMKDYWRNYIGGKWVDGSDGGRITLLNPATGRPLAEVARATAADVDRAVAAARRCVDSRALVDMRPMARGRASRGEVGCRPGRRRTLPGWLGCGFP